MKDPGYLRKKGYLLLDRDGNTVDQNKVNWSALGPRNFPYIVRQPAGPDNALGQVKFMFPNEHFVFLHDTNHRELFAHSERAFSSGCIRVENPLKLAELLLDDRERWNAEGIDKALATQRTQTVKLPKPLPVLLLYWTIAVAPDGSVSFYKDVYGRDQRIVDVLTKSVPRTLSAFAQ
jgi:murein L,D-transpeptidase YcbB/YkuD